ncbi:MAG: peptidylprolyl isomerase, partial [Betaproteobacteria bacterium]
MKRSLIAVLLAVAFTTLAPVAALAQNIAIVNGKAVPTSRIDALTQQLEKAGRKVTPEMKNQMREEVIAREVFMQEAQKRGLDATDDFKFQMELARQSILIRELFNEYQTKNPGTTSQRKRAGMNAL